MVSDRSIPKSPKVPVRVFFFLALGTLAVSQSANIIRLGEAHAVAIAAWRLGIATILLAGLAGRQLGMLWCLSLGNAVLLVLSGFSLATHFFAWITAVQLTTVANASMFFAINPIFMAVAAFFVFKERVGIKLVISILLGLGGIAMIGLDELSLLPKHMAGNAWAVVCAILFTAYFMFGKKLRQVLPTHAYVTGVYGVAAVIAFVCLALLKEPFFEYNRKTWLCFVLMALLPTMIGHTSFNHALRYIRAGWLSAITLVEPVLAGLVAYYAWGEPVTPQLVLGYGLICLSVLVLAFDRPAAARRATQANQA